MDFLSQLMLFIAYLVITFSAVFCFLELVALFVLILKLYKYKRSIK